MLDATRHTPPEHAINALARRQHRVVALKQLVGLGLSASAIRSRVAGGIVGHSAHGCFPSISPSSTPSRAPVTLARESELEELMLAICRTAAVAAPEVNAWLALDDGTAFRPDFLWREQRLIVETDGRDVQRAAGV